MKSALNLLVLSCCVTPFVGVWIEISEPLYCFFSVYVTPFVGVWIEISITSRINSQNNVTPFVGVWIEIYLYMMLVHKLKRHCVGVWIRI